MVYKSIMTTDDLAFDSRHIWHPYTSMTKPLPVYPVVSAEGCELHLANGEHLVDGLFGKQYRLSEFSALSSSDLSFVSAYR